jgi:hypothetical protein
MEEMASQKIPKNLNIQFLKLVINQSGAYDLISHRAVAVMHSGQ